MSSPAPSGTLAAPPILWPAGPLDPTQVGDRAATLAALADAGFDVPPFFVVPPGAAAPGAAPTPGQVLDAAAILGPGPFALHVSPLTQHASPPPGRADVAGAELPAALAALRADAGGAILVQRQVAPRFAGTASSADPDSGARDRLCLTAQAGSGPPHGFAVAADGRISITRTPPGGSGLRPPPMLIQRVAQLTRAAEAHAGAPQRIAWAFDGERLWLLEAGPMPNLPPDPAGSALWDTTGADGLGAPIGPLAFSVASLAWGLAARRFAAALGVRPHAIAAAADAFARLLGRIEGRACADLGSWGRVARLIGGPRLARWVETAPPGAALPPLPRLGARFAHLLLWRLAWRRDLHRALAAFDRPSAPTSPALATRDLPALAAHYRQLERALAPHAAAFLLAELRCRRAYDRARRLFRLRADDPDAARLHAHMAQRTSPLLAEPAARLAALRLRLAAIPGLADRLAAAATPAGALESLRRSALRADLQLYLDRCDGPAGVLSLDRLSLAEAPGPLIAALLAPAASGATAAPPPDAPLPAAPLPAGPFDRWRLNRRVRALAARLDERARLHRAQARLLRHVRALFGLMAARLVAGGYLAQPADLWMLTLDEVLGVAEGTADPHALRGLAEARAAARPRHGAAPLPARFRTHGLPGADTPRPLALTPPVSPEPDRQTRHGQGVSPGIAAAPLALLRDPGADRPPAGAILVAAHIDPGWHLSLAAPAGIVLEHGDPLGPVAIMARARGIPCVVGVIGALEWLPNGTRLRIDGATGILTRLS